MNIIYSQRTHIHLWACSRLDGCLWLLSSSPGDTLWRLWRRVLTSSRGVHPALLRHLLCVWLVWGLLESVGTSHPSVQRNCGREDLQRQSSRAKSFKRSQHSLFLPYSAHARTITNLRWWRWDFSLSTLTCEGYFNKYQLMTNTKSQNALF